MNLHSTISCMKIGVDKGVTIFARVAFRFLEKGMAVAMSVGNTSRACRPLAESALDIDPWPRDSRGYAVSSGEWLRIRRRVSRFVPQSCCCHGNPNAAIAKMIAVMTIIAVHRVRRVRIFVRPVFALSTPFMLDRPSFIFAFEEIRTKAARAGFYRRVDGVVVTAAHTADRVLLVPKFSASCGHAWAQKQ